jgi:hypothetical protein
VAALKDQASMFVSAELRWFWQDECPAELHRWFFETPPAPGGGQSRIDQYLLLTDQSEISIKRRGENPDVEIKGLVARLRNEGDSFAPHVELWCKWRIQASTLDITGKAVVRKVRWLRTYDASGAPIVEVSLQPNERSLSGTALPQHGCNVEITKILLDGEPRQWWTLGFEAFGDLDSAPFNLQRTVEFLVSRSFPLPASGEFLNYPSWLARHNLKLQDTLDHGDDALVPTRPDPKAGRCGECGCMWKQ